jgi:hypothetical protein
MKAPLGQRFGRLCALFVLALAGSLVFSTAPAWAATGEETELTVTCEWTIDKSAHPSELTLQLGQQATVTYTVTVDRTCAEPPPEPPCVEVDDSFGGDLGFVCAGDPLPATFTYQRTFGPFSQCGEQFFENHAVLEIPGPDNIVIARAFHTLRVNVPCEGCALTIGYWKTHAGFGPQADAVTPLLPVWLGNPGGAKSILVDSAAEAVQFLSLRGSNDVLRASNGINKLYAQLLAAKLNILSGADPSAVASVITAADNFLSNKNSTNWATLSAAKRALVLSWVNTLDAYNNGVIGPGHCTE